MWRCLPFKSKSLEKGKATRKRTELNLKNGDFFPPEGHCSLHLLSENVEDDTGSYRKVLYFGGALERKSLLGRLQVLSLKLLTSVKPMMSLLLI